MQKHWLIGLVLAVGISSSGAANAQLKIGVGAPITGPNAAFGAQIQKGAEQAAEDINAAGGILGQKIQILVGDDHSDPKEGVSVANKFVAEGVRHVVGHYNSGVMLPASDVYKENGILAITPGAINSRITDRPGYWNIFRTIGRDDQQAGVSVAYIVDKLADKKIAIVHDKTTFGKGIADHVQEGINKAGIKEVLYEGINVGEKDFTAVVSKLKASHADIVFWGGVVTEGGLILRQMRDQGVSAVMMGSSAISSSEFASIAGTGAEGTLMTFSADPRKRPEAAAVVKKFEAKNFDPESNSLFSYAAVEILKQAAERANSLDPKQMAEAMHSGKPFKTVIGDISYDAKGDITRLDWVIYTWKKGPDGRITYVEN